MLHSVAISIEADAPKGTSASLAETARIALDVSTPWNLAKDPSAVGSRGSNIFVMDASSIGEDNWSANVGEAPSGSPST